MTSFQADISGVVLGMWGWGGFGGRGEKENIAHLNLNVIWILHFTFWPKHAFEMHYVWERLIFTIHTYVWKIVKMSLSLTYIYIYMHFKSVF